jgi:cellulose synthase/poly-beta-1,6-N-acetylglucosamine synthase-like glycosyltransferase
VVYVDSNSTDSSVALAESMGAEVVQLDLSVPFTAARARNVGFERLEQIAPDVEFVQVVDGDCEVAAEWLDSACDVLDSRTDVAVVFGRRRERHPEETLFNRLADLEWDVPVGEVKACGGDAMIRAEAWRKVGGYNPAIIAGEEPELCLRIRAAGWKVLRLDAEMTLHDMAMTRFSEWWRRALRCGHAYAEGAARHGRSAEKHCVREVRSTVLWGLVLPLLALGLAWPSRSASLLLLGAYLIPYSRAARYFRTVRSWSAADARVYAAFCVLAKFPQLAGVAKYWWRRIRRQPAAIIEYRGAQAQPAGYPQHSSPITAGDPGR